MALQKFNFAALAEIDGGRLRAKFDQLLERIRLDCVDRAALKKARSVKLQVNLTPIADNQGNLTGIDVSFDVEPHEPKSQSPTYNMIPQRGGIAFNELSPDDARQGTLDEARKPKAVAGGAT